MELFKKMRQGLAGPKPSAGPPHPALPSPSGRPPPPPPPNRSPARTPFPCAVPPPPRHCPLLKSRLRRPLEPPPRTASRRPRRRKPLRRPSPLPRRLAILCPLPRRPRRELPPPSSVARAATALRCAAPRRSSHRARPHWRLVPFDFFRKP